ncbi:AMP-binding protein [Streptomyces sp. NPDC058371]|uniref:AMP-binding protein n=1 Tax=Streptomyces sp. NPDC058371 TaxID=3346463 RepID=UPI00365FDF8C
MADDLAVLHGDPLPDLPVRNLAEALVRAARMTDAGEIVCLNGSSAPSVRSYADLLLDAARILRGARDRGVRPGDRVVLQISDQLDLLAAFWACQLGGFVPVPLTADPPVGSPLSAAGLVAGVCGILDEPWVISPEGVGVPRWLGTVDGMRSESTAHDFHAVGLDDPAVLLLTSGSTGVPKAVTLTQRNILSRAHATALVRGLSRRNRTFNWMPLDHVGGLIMFHVRDVFLGCHQVHARIPWVLEDPLRWLDAINEYRCDTTWAPNFAFGLVADQADRIASRSWDLSTLVYVMNGGEAVKPKVARRFLSLLAPFGLPPSAMHPGWGMSETSSGVVDCVLPAEDSTDEDRFVCVGRPHPGVSVRVVDDDGWPVKAGVIGRVQVTGAPVTPGYYDNDRQNQQSFSVDGWFKTGDLGFVSAGGLTVTGRADDVIEIDGVAYYGHEIESAVEELPFVEPSFTVACAGVSGGSLAVAFHPRSGTTSDLNNWRVVEHVANRFGIGVSRVCSVRKEDVAKTGIGKIKRLEVAQLLAAYLSAC